MASSSQYKVMARSKRPQRFDEVIGQDKIKTTLKNAYLMQRLGHAYLFSGSHGIGKTTLARIFAKVLNCDNPSNGEPCDQCSSCKEIREGYSLDVIEIDGASNRGIDDIRQINESVSFAAKAGKYKIYILDEVHMLTKEAFNALLKTLEDPPSRVKFLFATTEPHKIPSTILSRCQCFYLEPLTHHEIAMHLTDCVQSLGFQLDEKAAYMISERARGSLRDALVLTDQLISFSQGTISTEKISHFLGLMPKSELFNFDKQGKEGQMDAAFSLTQSLFDSGKNISNFLADLCEHFRQILYIKIFKGNPNCLKVSDTDWPHYQTSATYYTYEQCLYIIDLILEAQNKIKNALSKQIALENLLIQIIRSHQRVTVKSLIDQLDALKSNLDIMPLKKESYIEASPPKEEVITPSLEPSQPEIKAQTKEPAFEPKKDAKNQNICYNTLMQFAAVELEGSLKKEGN